MRVYLDSCIAIYLVEEVEPWHTLIEQQTRQGTDQALVASHLVRMECLVLPFRQDDTDLVARFGRFFDRCDVAGVDGAAFERAARLRAATPSLRTPDALHLGCAIEEQCDEFWTNDHRLDRLSLPLTIRVFESVDT